MDTKPKIIPQYKRIEKLTTTFDGRELRDVKWVLTGVVDVRLASDVENLLQHIPVEEANAFIDEVNETANQFKYECLDNTTLFAMQEKIRWMCESLLRRY